MTAVNPSWERVLGYTPQALTSRPYLNFVHPDDFAPTIVETRKLQAPGQTAVAFENRYRAEDGNYRWLSWNSRTTGDGEQIFCIVRDVTEQVLARQALTESENRFREMFYSHDSVMLLIDPGDGGIVDANSAAADFYGYPIDELRSMQISQINALPAQEVAQQQAKTVARDRNQFRFPHRLANCEIRTVDVFSSPIQDRGRQLLFSIVHDVTEQVLPTEALVSSEKLLRLAMDGSPPPGDSDHRAGLRIPSGQSRARCVVRPR